jgi:hypothetical protein
MLWRKDLLNPVGVQLSQEEQKVLEVLGKSMMMLEPICIINYNIQVSVLHKI